MALLQPYPTLTSSDPQSLMNAINQIARIHLQEIAAIQNANTASQNIASTGIIACTATGTNTIALQQNANQNVVTGYVNYQQFSFISAHTSTGSVTINVNGIGALNLYKADGINQAQSGTIVAGTAYTIAYNSALNSAAGGFQIMSGALNFFKTGFFTRDVSTASGTQAITGVGFTPKLVLFRVCFSTGGNAASASWGEDDGANPQCFTNETGSFAPLIDSLNSIDIINSGGNTSTAKITAFGTDGFTLTWVKTGSPTGTLIIYFTAMG